MRWAAVAPLLPSDTSIVVVEFGCGEGAFGTRLAARYAGYVGVEPAAESAAVASERVRQHGGMVVPSWDDPANPVENGTPAALCAFEVLEHLDDDVGALREWTRVLAPGSLVVVSVPGEPDRYGPWDENVGHYRRYSIDSLTEVFTRAGLVSPHAFHYGYPFGYALEAARNTIARRRPVDTDAVDMEERTSGSGRLRQPRSSLGGDLRWAVTAPFRAWQRSEPRRGPGLVGTARVPDAG